jgi:hypothetical protein
MTTRSPRWAFMQHLTIPDAHGEAYLHRLRIVNTPWFGINLHDIHLPDTDKDPHDHPWNFVSVVLRGGYGETLYTYDTVRSVRSKVWRRGSIHRMRTRSFHHIHKVEPGTRTLVFTGKRSKAWGFQTRTGFVPWQEYMK